MRKGFFYLATPYTHAEEEVRQMRYELARDVTARLSKLGIFCFSPITHSHDMAKANEMPYTFEFWDEWNRIMIDASIGIIVVRMHGWETSKGVAAEIQYAESIGKPRLDIYA